MKISARKKSLLFATACLLALLACSCTPKVVGLVQDPNFTAGAIMDSGLAVAAIANASGPIAQGEAGLYGRLLLDRITKERKIFSVKPLEQVMAAMGPEAYGKMVAQYGQNGVVPEDSLKALQGLKGARYFIFARIEADSVDHNNENYSNNVVTKRDQAGNPIKTDVETTSRYVTTRSVSVGFDIYDISTGRSVWSGSLQDTASRSTDYKDVSDSANHGWDTLAKDVVRNTVLGPREYPPPPPIQEALQGVFAGFAKSLPKA